MAFLPLIVERASRMTTTMVTTLASTSDFPRDPDTSRGSGRDRLPRSESRERGKLFEEEEGIRRAGRVPHDSQGRAGVVVRVGIR